MKNLILILFSTFYIGQTNQYKEILLSKKINATVTSYQNGYGLVHNWRNKNESIVDSLGNVTFTSPTNSSISPIFKNRFILYLNEKKYNRKTGLIDHQGKVLIEPDYQEFGNWWNSKQSIVITKNNKDALYNFDGYQMIPFSDKIEYVGEERFFVRNDKNWQLYDSNGSLITTRNFKDYSFFEKGKALLINEKEQSEIIDLQGKILHQFSKYKVQNIETYPLLKVTKDKKFGLIDLEENLIAKEQYDYIFSEYSQKESYIYLEKSDRKDLFSLKENKLYTTQYKYLNFLFDNYFSTYNEKSQKKGLIKINDENIFQQEYDNLEHYKVVGKDFIFVEKDKNQKILDSNFNSILAIPFNLIAVFPNQFIIESLDKYYSFNPENRDLKEIENVISIKKQNLIFFNPIENYSRPLVCKNLDNLFGILDENLQELIPFIYDDIITFSNSENQIVVKKANKFGVINYQNETLKDAIYDSYQWMKEVLKLTKNKKIEHLNFTRIEMNN